MEASEQRSTLQLLEASDFGDAIVPVAVWLVRLFEGKAGEQDSPGASEIMECP